MPVDFWFLDFIKLWITSVWTPCKFIWHIQSMDVFLKALHNYHQLYLVCNYYFTDCIVEGFVFCFVCLACCLLFMITLHSIWKPHFYKITKASLSFPRWYYILQGVAQKTQCKTRSKNSSRMNPVLKNVQVLPFFSVLQSVLIIELW